MDRKTRVQVFENIAVRHHQLLEEAFRVSEDAEPVVPFEQCGSLTCITMRDLLADLRADAATAPPSNGPDSLTGS